MVRIKPTYTEGNVRYINGKPYNLVKVRRHRVHPARIARALTLWQVIVESLMERYPWAVIENLWDWLLYRYDLWTQPKFVVPIQSTGRVVRVADHKAPKPDWIVLRAKKAQR